MDMMIFSSVLHFCAFYLVQCSLGLLAPESVGTCGLSLSIWPQLALHLLLGLVLLPLARAALTHRAAAAPPRLLHERPPPPLPPTARPTRSRPDLVGMERYETRLLDFLERDADADDQDDDGTAPAAASTSSSTLGVVGARGVGKTTLLRLAYQYYYCQRFFRYVFHADAREAGGDGSFTADALRGLLARDVGCFWPGGEDHVASFLRNRSFVLLLDGVRAGGVGLDVLVAAGVPATLGPRQKVVFATRDESVCAAMGCTDDAGNVIRMRCLGDDDAWNLFRSRVGGDFIDSATPMIKRLAKEIVLKCRGYPGALAAVGGTMSTRKNWESWSVANELLGKSSRASGAIHDDQGRYPCLQSFKEQFW